MAWRIQVLLLHVSSAQFVYQVLEASVTRSVCQSRCRRLPCIRDAADNAALHGVISALDPVPAVWLGYTDVVSEGTWEWGPNCSSSYTNWASRRRQPDNSGNEDCGVMWPGSTWNDEKCSVKSTCVCEVCPAGSFLNDTGCVPCGAGSFAAELDSSSCTPCSTGYNSVLGQSSCLPEAGTAVAALATPNLTVAHNGLGYLHLSMEVEPLPAVYGNLTLLYATSLRSNNGSADALTCRLEQQSATLLAASFSMEQLQAECAWNMSESNHTVRVSGVVTLLVGEQGRPSDLGSFQIPILVDFPKLVYSARRFSTPLLLEEQVFPVPEFSSGIAFYETVQYRAQKLHHYFLQGETAFVEHSLAGSASLLYLQVQQAWLATSLDPVEAKAVHVNLTKVIRSESAKAVPGRARFSFEVPHCPHNCALHVVSLVSHRGRRLTTSTERAHAVVPLHVQQPEEEGVDTGALIGGIAIGVVITILGCALVAATCFVLRRRQHWRNRRVEA